MCQKAARHGKVTKFGNIACHILGSNRKMIARSFELANVAGKTEIEDIWHRQFGYLGTGSLQKLAKDHLVEGFDYNVRKGGSFSESCVEGKHLRSIFPVNKGKRSQEPLYIVHSDVCGKIY